MSNRGRKPILTNSEAQDIINRFIQKYENISKINYIEIHRFSVELYNTGQLKQSPSESYWRKKDRIGRQLVDEANFTLSHKVTNKNSNSELDSLLQLLDDHSFDENTNNIIHKVLIKKFNDLKLIKKELFEEKQKNEELSDKNKKLNSLNSEQQVVIYQLYHYFLGISSKDNSTIFENALGKIFSEPLNFIELMNKKSVKKNNVSEIFKNRLNT